jgi:hypothetical protein
MSDISRRTFVTAGASLLATSASLMKLRGTEAATHDAGHDPLRGSNGLPQPSHLQTSGEMLAMEGHHTSEKMKRCIQLCQDCHATCAQMIDHCLRLGGRYAAADHLLLLMDCAQMCTTTADIMARESSFHDRTCGLCSELCRLCAESCEQVAGDEQMVKQCAELCRRCAGSCERMASKSAA